MLEGLFDENSAVSSCIRPNRLARDYRQAPLGLDCGVLQAPPAQGKTPRLYGNARLDNLLII